MLRKVRIFSHACKDSGEPVAIINDNINSIDETPENSSEANEDGLNDVIALKREISSNSFLSPNSEKMSEKKKNLINKPLNFTEEQNSFKPPRRLGAGRTVPGKFFGFGKNIKGQTPVKEREPLKCVILDVGGERFIAQRNSLLKYPTTRLGKLMRASTIQGILTFCDEFVPGDPPEYFFDKNPENFAAILEMHRSGYFHISGNGCALVLQRDLEYWVIDELIMEPCCALKYFPQIEICNTEKEGDIIAKRKELKLADEEDFGSSFVGKWRSWLWNTMEYPWTSKTARFCAFFSLTMVLISTVTFIVSTIDELQENDHGEVEFPLLLKVIDVIDNISIGFFTMEYILRLACSPRKFKFMKGPMNMIDLLAIIPFYVSILLEGLEDFEIIGKAGKIIRLIKVMRILRIYKLVRHFAGLQSLFYTLQQAYKELGLLFILVAVAILTFSSLVYFAEKGLDVDRRDEGEMEKTFKLVAGQLYGNHSWTFIESFWWGLMTLTTVGYDLNPETLLGKIIGGCCALSGVFILTLPIPIVVNSFATYYKNRMWRNEVNMRKRERTRQQAVELRQMQKLFLLKAMSSPGEGTMVAEQPDLCGDGQKTQVATARLHQATNKLSRIL